jgi:hypothetical protein
MNKCHLLGQAGGISLTLETEEFWFCIGGYTPDILLSFNYFYHFRFYNNCYLAEIYFFVPDLFITMVFSYVYHKT